jgi:hypothetical protein
MPSVQSTRKPRGTRGTGVELPDPYRAAPQLRLGDLLTEPQARLQTVPATRDRVYALLEAVVAVSTNLGLEMVLKQIVEAAAPGGGLVVSPADGGGTRLDWRVPVR